MMFRAGAASLELDVPPGLWTVGAIRQAGPAREADWPLEVTALVLENSETRVALCGVDVLAFGVPEAAALARRIGDTIGCDPSAVLINCSHTHHAPPGDMSAANRRLLFASSVDTGHQASLEFVFWVESGLLSVCALAADRLEAARPVWGAGSADLAVNRRERTRDGRTIVGWNPSNVVDQQVVVLQARRPDESVIATLVSYGCHPLTLDTNRLTYSADFPGPMRKIVRGVTGGECIFFQGAGGDVMPRFSFAEDLGAMTQFGTRLGVEALHCVADRYSGKARAIVRETARAAGNHHYQLVVDEPPEPALRTAVEWIEIPLLPLPTQADLVRLRSAFDTTLAEAEATGDVSRIRAARYWASWVDEIETQIREGIAPSKISAPVHALRIGDGVIVTAPGEPFTEIGLAVKARSPGDPTLYAGYTNGVVSYFPTRVEYEFGGYEVEWAHYSWSLPSAIDQSVEATLIDTSVRLMERLFPARDVLADAPVIQPGSEPVDHPDPMTAAGMTANWTPRLTRPPIK
jgi:hypothetical protein